MATYTVTTRDDELDDGATVGQLLGDGFSIGKAIAPADAGAVIAWPRTRIPRASFRVAVRSAPAEVPATTGGDAVLTVSRLLRRGAGDGINTSGDTADLVQSAVTVTHGWQGA